MRSEVLCLVSLGLTLTVLGNAWVQRQQFYPSVVYITKSNPSMAVIYLQSLVLVVLLGKVMRKIFFGQLRAAEFEHLMERSWYAVTETCLAFTVFKDDFSPKFVGLFVLLLFLKSFHWLAEERVDFMERSPVIVFLFHLRVLSLSVFLAAMDILFIQHACTSTITKGASVQLVFGFEYAILLTIILNTLIKYVLHSVDLYSETPWENKAVYMLYTELFIGFIKVMLYALFFMIMVRIFTLPLFAVRPMYLTMRTFKKAFNDVVLSRRAIHNMNTMYPDATAQELENTDNVCIICREEMAAPSAKKLPCNHIFHRSCLRSWFQRQQTCPTCRLDVLRVSPPPAAAAPTPAAAAANFQQQVAALRQQLETYQQQRNQQQQQQQHNVPNFFNLLGLPPQPPQQPGQGLPGSSPAAGTAGASAPPEAVGARPSLMLPPFPPFMAFNVPPPMPPPNFQGMSEAELREMEGAERQHVEARIRCLRNVQVLLDAAMFEMQQYAAVVARCSAQQTVQRASSTTDAASTATATAAMSTTPTNTMSTTATTTTTTMENATKSFATTTATASAATAAPGVPVITDKVVSSGGAIAPGLSQPLSNEHESRGREGGVKEPSEPGAPVIDGYEGTGARPKANNSSNVNAKPILPVITSCDKTGEASPDTALTRTGVGCKEDGSPVSSIETTPEQEEIRRRRLAVFEEQKKRLMKK